MGRKKVLEKRQARLLAKKAELIARSNASNDVAEVRAINEQLQTISEDLQDIADELEAIAAEEGGEGEGAGSGEGSADEGRSGAPLTGVETRGGNPMASYMQSNPQEQRQNEDPFATMEYRNSFKAYVQKGTPIPAELRAGGEAGTTVAAELGMIIPTTIMNEFIKEVSKVYGQIYGKVRKLNVQGGVKFPISKLKANFTWITETTPSGKQKAGDITEYVEFSYNIGEIRVASTLLANVVSLALFEKEIVTIMLEAYVEAMDKAIVSGTGAGQPLGILNDTRITNVIELTEVEFSDWKAWRKKLFSVIPLSKRGKGEFIFTASTIESYLLTMEDGNQRPVFKEATELSVGESATSGKFYGRNVEMVEPDVVADFATAAAGDVVGIYWIPSDYAINTNLAFGMKRYFDEDTNEWINKGLTIVDGKMLDVSGCYIIKKKA